MRIPFKSSQTPIKHFGSSRDRTVKRAGSSGFQSRVDRSSWWPVQNKQVDARFRIFFFFFSFSPFAVICTSDHQSLIKVCNSINRYHFKSLLTDLVRLHTCFKTDLFACNLVLTLNFGSTNQWLVAPENTIKWCQCWIKAKKGQQVKCSLHFLLILWKHFLM